MCSLHGENKVKNTGNIIIFNNSSLSKCKTILTIRKESELKYCNIELPDKISEIHGYHISCYRKFSALSHAHRNKIKVITEENHSRGNNRKSNNIR